MVASWLYHSNLKLLVVTEGHKAADITLKFYLCFFEISLGCQPKNLAGI